MKKCRCGCNEIATHKFIGLDFDKTPINEYCCRDAGLYMAESSMELGQKYKLFQIRRILNSTSPASSDDTPTQTPGQ